MTGRVGNGIGNLADVTSATNSVNPYIWHHFALTSTGDTTTNGCILYLNGANVGTFTGYALHGNSLAKEVQVGLNYHNGSFSGKLIGNADEVSLYDSVLTPTHISALYNSGAPVSPASVGLSPYHYYRMGDLTDTTSVTYDRGGTGIPIDLAVVSAPTNSTDVP